MRAVLFVLLLAACDKPKPAATAEPGPAPTPAPAPVAAPTPSPPPGFNALASGPVAFSLDGKPADTATRADDIRDPSGNYQAARKLLVIALYGDAPGAASRGFLTLAIEGFPGAPGEYPAQLRFARPVDGAAEPVRYHTEAAKALVTITDFSPGVAPGLWRATGTFRAPAAALDEGMKSTQPTVAITDGKFDNLLVHGLGN